MSNLFPNGVSAYLIGGLLVGLAVSLTYLTTGLMTGQSSFFSSALSFFVPAPYFRQGRYLSGRSWQVAFALGTVTGAVLVTWLVVGKPFVTEVQWWRLAAGGFLVGFGARLSRGCTSGHGICGIASLSGPSIGAVIVFLTVAIFTSRVVQHFGVTP